jgi:hypothetical protein
MELVLSLGRDSWIRGRAPEERTRAVQPLDRRSVERRRQTDRKALEDQRGR